MVSTSRNVEGFIGFLALVAVVALLVLTLLGIVDRRDERRVRTEQIRAVAGACANDPQPAECIRLVFQGR